jgi:hypothetical protein
MTAPKWPSTWRRVADDCTPGEIAAVVNYSQPHREAVIAMLERTGHTVIAPRTPARRIRRRRTAEQWAGTTETAAGDAVEWETGT